MSDYEKRIILVWPSYYVVRAYCKCGDALQINTDDPDHIEDALGDFWCVHNAEGHQPCDARHCLAARRKREAKEVR